MFRRFLTPKALYSKAQGQRRRESGRAPPWVIVEQNDLRRRRYTGRLTVALFLWNAFGVRVFLRLFTQGARPTTATPRHPRPWALEYNRFAVKKSDRSTSDDALDEESLTALGVGREMRQRFEGEGAKQWQL